MPKLREVPSLKSLSIKSVGGFVAHMSPVISAKVSYIKEPQMIAGTLQKHLDKLNGLIDSYVPHNLYDSVAEQILTSIVSLIDKTKKDFYPRVPLSGFMTEMNVVVSLTEVVVNSKLKTLDFSRWPKIMRYILYKSLKKMNGLQVLNLGSCIGGLRTTELHGNIINGIKVMRNLHTICLCFDCTDLIVQVLSESCPFIQHVDVTSSGSVTDRSIPFFIQCKNLRVVQLSGTSVTINGLAKLITSISKLEDIGRCDQLREVIIKMYLKDRNYGPFGLKRISTRYITIRDLECLVTLFPKIEFLSLFDDMIHIDVTVLESLVHLKELKLLSWSFYKGRVDNLLEKRGFNYTDLHLEHVEELDFRAIRIIGKCCQNLKSLVLYNCDCKTEIPSGIDPAPLYQFSKLEKLVWVADNSVDIVEYILSYAVNIRHIHLGSSTGITHRNIVNILNANPMKYLETLRILYGDMNMRTVELILASCTNLKILSELESWQDIYMTELTFFKNHIKVNNFDLDIRPTLSFSR